MDDQSRILDLLEEALESHRTPEEICADCPELLPEVRLRLRQCQSIDAQIEAMFPTPNPALTSAVRRSSQSSWAKFPQIPGYEIESILGRGGMGVVYKARHLKLDRPVALKMLLAGEYASALELTRFTREAKSVAIFHHPNIVQIHDVGEFDGRAYYTMEYMEGGSLASKLMVAPLPPRQAAEIVCILAEAVHEAHKAGIVHRDLKPGNILLAEDGTPKITDFGLAKHFEGESALTLNETKVGTPSYMSPEQALATPDAFSPLVDVYSLGAILYDALTGKPPFHAATAAETQRQVIDEDPVTPSRLNAKVPRDLETICLKCLQKDSAKRYKTAAALALDLKHYLHGEPIAAHPIGLVGRAGKWVRRRPAAAVGLAATFLLVLTIAGTILLLNVQQKQRQLAVLADLKEVADYQEHARWTDAQAALQRADARLEGSNPANLRSQIDQAQHDLDLVMRLDNIRLSRVTNGGLVYYRTKANDDYKKAFADVGLAKLDDAPVDVAAKIRASSIRRAIVSALDDWAVSATDSTERSWLLEIARRSDPDPEGWRDRIRNAAAWDNPDAMAELARNVPANGDSVSLLLALGERIKNSGGDATAYFKRIQKEHPADFWANLTLGNSLLNSLPDEAGIYYRSALGSRPDAAVSYVAVGDSLRLQHLPNEAFDYYTRALQLDPNYARALNNLGNTFKDLMQIDQAMAAYEKSLQCDPHYAWADFGLANTLRELGKPQDSVELYKKVIDAAPTESVAINGLRGALVQMGQGKQALDDWAKTVKITPKNYDVWNGYPELCLYMGDENQYRRVRDRLLDRFADTSDVSTAEGVARASLLLPCNADELQKASALASRATAAKGVKPHWIYAYYLFAKGLADYREGKFGSAMDIMNGEASKILGACPKLVVAMCQYQQGDIIDARKSLGEAVTSVNWSTDLATHRDIWIAHALRREAQQLIMPGSNDFFVGNYSPRDNDDRFVLLGECQFRGEYGKAVKLYADAFAANQIAENNLRFEAAAAAALAGCGMAADRDHYTDEQRSAWRQQALEWLNEDLAYKVKNLDPTEPDARNQLHLELLHWQYDPQLAGLRNLDQLQKLPTDQREACLALWQSTAAAAKQLDDVK